MLQSVQPLAELRNTGLDVLLRALPQRDIQGGGGDRTPELRTAEGGHVREPVTVQPGRGAFVEDRGAHRIHAPAESFACHDDVGLDTLGVNTPQIAGTAETGLHFVGNVQGARRLARLLRRREVAGLGHRETVCCGHRFQDHRRHVVTGERIPHRVNVVEGNLHEVGRVVGVEEPREPLVSRGDRQPCVAVVGALDGDDLAAPGGESRTLDREVNDLAAAGAENDFARPGGELDETFGERRAPGGGKVVVADIHVVERVHQRGDDLGVAVAQVEGSAVEVNVENGMPVDIGEDVPLSFPDDEGDFLVYPELSLVGVPIRDGVAHDLRLAVITEHL